MAAGPTGYDIIALVVAGVGVILGAASLAQGSAHAVWPGAMESVV